MSRNYETLFFIESGIEQEITEELLTKVKETISKNNGEVKKVDNWGNRSLAVPVDGVTQANYFLIDFIGDNQTLEKLQRFYLINNQDILRFSLFRKEEKVHWKKAKKKSVKSGNNEEKKYFAGN